MNIMRQIKDDNYYMAKRFVWIFSLYRELNKQNDKKILFLFFLILCGCRNSQKV